MPPSAKRRREAVHCGGCGCRQPECESCFPAELGGDQASASSQVSAGHQPAPHQVLDHLATASRSPSAQVVIKSAYDRRTQRLARQVINFDHDSKEVWRTLNTSHYTRLSGSKQFDAAGDVLDEILGCVHAIGDQVRDRSATILLNDDTLGHEIRKEFQWESSIPEFMLRIAKSMTVEERERAAATTDQKRSLVEEVEAVLEHAQVSCIDGFDGLGTVLKLLRNEDGNENGGENAVNFIDLTSVSG
ncbi:hypothetical protein F5Y15DRAFT_416035 [Xylariaceae sp. FL0016]|nr:hypothetical protein F5Y15DRAFT_416035 [Xylariaceae sp. FL0016]